MTVDANTRRLIYKISRAYYEDGLTQKQIGHRFGLSRIKISRMLQLAKDLKIVQITLSPVDTPNAELEQRLERQFGISEAIIVQVENPNKKSIAKALGMAAAECLVRSIQGNEVLAVTWGCTLLSMVEALPAENWPELRVVQSLGGLNQPDADINGSELARRMAQAFNAKPLILSSPGIVESKAIRDALLQDPQISRVLTLAGQANIALVGIGGLTQDSPVSQMSILNKRDIKRLKYKGAVGEIGLRFFDADGIIVSDEFDDRVVGLDLREYQEMQRVIGVAGGAEKLEAIHAVLRGRLVDVMVMDEDTALKLL